SGGLAKLDHLIFIVQENRSFDHYFGTFPGADGIPTKHGHMTPCVPDPALHHCARMYHTHKLLFKGGPHAHHDAVTDVDHGKMDGFIRAAYQRGRGCAYDRKHKDCPKYLGPQRQPDVMSYVTGQQIPNYWSYARRYVLQDRMF